MPRYIWDPPPPRLALGCSWSGQPIGCPWGIMITEGTAGHSRTPPWMDSTPLSTVS
jgi:hypothetical protein